VTASDRCPAVHPDSGYRCHKPFRHGAPEDDGWHEVTDGLVTAQWESDVCPVCWFGMESARLFRTEHSAEVPCKPCLWAYGPDD